MDTVNGVEAVLLTIDSVRQFCYPQKIFALRRTIMRAPFQILSIPYRIIHNCPYYCVFHRADCDRWQFIAGGGEDNETAIEAAKRETFEEGGIRSDKWMELKSLSYIPVAIISEKCRKHWDKDIYVIPEYTFGFECQENIQLSHEHTECIWLTYEEADRKLKWDSNRTALYELNCHLTEINRSK